MNGYEKTDWGSVAYGEAKTVERNLERLIKDVKTLREVLGTLISWTAQSANSPISPAEATVLLEKLK